MKLLILGGTIFLGRSMIEAALNRGHEVTIFNRGMHGRNLYANIEELRGDRKQDLAVLAGRSWDAVIDTNGYVPSTVRASVRALADNVKHYTFISTVSVYKDFSIVGMDETAPLEIVTQEQLQEAEAVDPPAKGTIARAYGEAYGALKASCEQVVEEIMPRRALVIRPGLIVGPHDYSDRFTYWVQRIALGGEILAPGEPDRQIQLIDVRDLADWNIRMAEAGQTGIYNATGPEKLLTMGQILAECKQVCANDARFTWVDESFLLEKDVTPWSELPLWISKNAEIPGFLALSIKRAFAAGLTFRPLCETIQDTLAWDSTRPANQERETGLKPEREAQLLQEWHRRRK